MMLKSFFRLFRTLENWRIDYFISSARKFFFKLAILQSKYKIISYFGFERDNKSIMYGNYKEMIMLKKCWYQCIQFFTYKRSKLIKSSKQYLRKILYLKAYILVIMAQWHCLPTTFQSKTKRYICISPT